MAKEVIKIDEVLALAKGMDVREPSFVQKVGLWLATGVGIMIAFVTGSVIWFLISHYPATPSLESLTHLAPEDTKTAIDHYKELSAVSVKSALDLFQTIVGQALLPVFTAILGYIFGKENNSNP